MHNIICNDFSLDMIFEDCKIYIKKLGFPDVQNILENEEYDVIIGDEQIAKDFDLKLNKGEILLGKDTRLIVIKSSTKGGYNFYLLYRI